MHSYLPTSYYYCALYECLLCAHIKLLIIIILLINVAAVSCDVRVVMQYVIITSLVAIYKSLTSYKISQYMYSDHDTHRHTISSWITGMMLGCHGYCTCTGWLVNLHMTFSSCDWAVHVMSSGCVEELWLHNDYTHT